MKQFIERNISFVKFCVVGAVSTLLDFVVYMLIVEQLGAVAKAISMCCSMVLSYLLNKLWSFAAKDTKVQKELVRYGISQVINISVNVSVNSFVLQKSGMKIVAFIIATGTAMVVNYFIQKKFVFGGGKTK